MIRICRSEKIVENWGTNEYLAIENGTMFLEIITSNFPKIVFASAMGRAN